ncbi:KGK domain-containing protein [Limnoraphis robusta]|uniref:KGK domain-containing protein n=1 Tax=Limnoraphis robusta CCNP1315 TaxID=3110306 RepID=A0ABU5U4L0_9CYAN|nr:KGK domain-containing protein [Limnoraphis robusta]MEA5522125.1 KGK domain-containing protein [Limnoraphis robusta CCNP1315]MEA5544171.1 KGK domain-containing protein [Limnoraphis robusta CCNP1324]
MNSNFNDGFQPLTNDEDVLLFGEDTFTVGLFAELVLKNIQEKISHRNKKGFTVFPAMRGGFSVDQKVPFELSESQWESSTQELECQLLGLGYSGWKKGRLRIKMDVNFFPQNVKFSPPVISPRQLQLYEAIIKIELEFSPDEPNEYQSPLDKLRQLESDLQKE